jgi:transcription termination factor Rho
VETRGGDAVVLIDTLDGPHPQPGRRALAAARNLSQAGSLTVIATSSTPLGGETTVIALDGALAAAAKFPALDLGASGTTRPELLVGEDGAAAIVAERLASQ